MTFPSEGRRMISPSVESERHCRTPLDIDSVTSCKEGDGDAT